MLSSVISFVRELAGELTVRADRWAKEAGTAPDREIAAACARNAVVLRELAGAIEAAAKRTLLA